MSKSFAAAQHKCMVQRHSIMSYAAVAAAAAAAAAAAKSLQSCPTL